MFVTWPSSDSPCGSWYCGAVGGRNHLAVTLSSVWLPGRVAPVTRGPWRNLWPILPHTDHGPWFEYEQPSPGHPSHRTSGLRLDLLTRSLVPAQSDSADWVLGHWTCNHVTQRGSPAKRKDICVIRTTRETRTMQCYCRLCMGHKISSIGKTRQKASPPDNYW